MICFSYAVNSLSLFIACWCSSLGLCWQNLLLAVLYVCNPWYCQYFPLCPLHPPLYLHELITFTLPLSVAFTSLQNLISMVNQTNQREHRMANPLPVLPVCAGSTLWLEALRSDFCNFPPNVPPMKVYFVVCKAFASSECWSDICQHTGDLKALETG